METKEIIYEINKATDDILLEVQRIKYEPDFRGIFKKIDDIKFPEVKVNLNNLIEQIEDLKRLVNSQKRTKNTYNLRKPSRPKRFKVIRDSEKWIKYIEPEY
jgi:hypothetical protein